MLPEKLWHLCCQGCLWGGELTGAVWQGAVSRKHLDWAICNVRVLVTSRTVQSSSSTSVNFLRISDNPACRVPSLGFYVTSAPKWILTYSKTHALLQGVLISFLASLQWGNYTQVAVIVAQLLVLAIFKAWYLVLFAGFMNAWLYTQETVLLCAADPWQIVCVLVAKFSWVRTRPTF